MRLRLRLRPPRRWVEKEEVVAEKMLDVNIYNVIFRHKDDWGNGVPENGGDHR